ncbi:MAG: hypothetical protein ABIO65_10320 [Nitrospiria bacterium]
MAIPAVVLGLGVNGLGVVRALGRHGVPVVGVHQRDEEAGRFSRYCRAVTVSPPARDRRAFLTELIALGSRRERPVLFPTSDEYVQILSDFREELSPVFRFNIPDAKTLEMIITKHGTHTLAERYGMPIPATGYPQTAEDVRELAGRFRFPCLVKPVDTFSVQFPQEAKNAVLSSALTLEQFYSRYPSLLGRTVVQEIIRGGDGAVFMCAAYFDAHSQVRGFHIGRKIRQYPPDYGITSLGESVYVEELEHLTVKFLQAVGYRGLIGVEYVQDRSTGAMYLLEMNARSIYYNRLPTDCGVNLAYLAYRDAIGAVYERPVRQREGVRWLDFLHDLGSFATTRRQGPTAWSAWLGSVIGARSFAYYDPRDLKPFGFSLMRAAALIIGKIRARVFGRKGGGR